MVLIGSFRISGESAVLDKAIEQGDQRIVRRRHPSEAGGAQCVGVQELVGALGEESWVGRTVSRAGSAVKPSC
jgi:hypothetical protein